MDLGLQPEMGLDHASFQITWWSLFSLACIPGIEKVVGWIWTAMDSEPRRWSVLWAQGTASYMSCKHCNYCTFSNNSPLPWLFRAVTELNLARMTTVTAIEGHLKTDAWSLSHTVCECKFACSLRWRFFSWALFPRIAIEGSTSLPQKALNRVNSLKVLSLSAVSENEWTL